LSLLPNLEEEGPETLAKSIRGVGCYLLPRYPEVRQSFRDLLNGPHGKDYHATLRESLNNPSPEIRRGAAMVLIVCDPANEGHALERVVQFKSRKDYALWHEWEQFCLSLSFGPSVLTLLKSKLKTLDSSSEIFALAILERNNISLSEEDWEKLVRGLLQIETWSVDAQEKELSVLAKDRSFNMLVNLVEEKVNDDAIKAAEKLLQYHHEKLSQDLYAKCACLAIIDCSTWGLITLSQEINKMENESYSDVVRKVATEIVSKGGKRPLLDLMHEALVDEKAWDDVIWRLLCNDSDFSTHFNIEINGQWLLDFVREKKKVGLIIGKTAKRFLNDPRVKSSRLSGIRGWLAIIAHEFDGFTNGEMEKVILQTSYGLDRSVRSALIARLNSFPAELKFSDKIPEFSTVQEPDNNKFPQLLESIREQARESDNLHPDVCNTLESLTLEYRVSEDDIISISSEGNHGILISSTLIFVYDLSPNMDYILKLLGFWPNLEQSNNPCFQRLTKMWRAGLLLKVIEDPQTKKNYISKLNDALLSNSFNKLAIAAELIRQVGYLTGSVIKKVLDIYTKNPFTYDYGLSDQLSKWLSGDINPESREILMEEIQRGLRTVDIQPEDLKSGFSRDGIRFLLLPLAYWKLTGKVSEESTSVFLKGIKLTFYADTPTNKRNGPIDTMSTLEPLILQIPKSILENVISSGNDKDDPAIKALCRLFSFKNVKV